jgi:lipopolysaccharide export system protein LptC
MLNQSAEAYFKAPALHSPRHNKRKQIKVTADRAQITNSYLPKTVIKAITAHKVKKRKTFRAASHP